jgi:hypothetical protein
MAGIMGEDSAVRFAAELRRKDIIKQFPVARLPTSRLPHFYQLLRTNAKRGDLKFIDQAILRLQDSWPFFTHYKSEVRAMLRYCAKEGVYPLHDAAAYNQKDVALFLLHYVGSDNLNDGNDWTPLDHAACKGYPELLSAMLEEARERRLKLEEHSLISFVCHTERCSIARVLRDHGVFDTQDPQHIARIGYQWHDSCALDRHCDERVDLEDVEGKAHQHDATVSVK